jgi:malate dehydrogenase (oxaloacetate-decarboxylating)(NADP+)
MLFFLQVVTSNIREIAPIIYTPTVGEACQKFNHLFTRARGMHFSASDRGHMASMAFNWVDDVDVIVVTDGGRILGLGDLGANGMGIPIGKCALYVASGIHPSRILPVMLDVGTNNPELLKDPRYLGLQHPRLSGEAYLEVVDEFMAAVRTRFPKVMVQFEDFTSSVAPSILKRYRYTHRCFNDDIQGTGAMTLGGLLSAVAMVNGGSSSLKGQRIVIVGAGSAGQGVARSIGVGLMYQGVPEAEAFKHFWVLDKDGLVHASRKGGLPFEEDLSLLGRQDSDLADGADLLTVVKHVKPTILLGVSGTAGIFTEAVVREMAKHTERPIIFPMSNPTSKCEATAADVIKWTDGRALFASGSPFHPTEYKGKTYVFSQANNFYVFPAFGLASIVCEPRRITEEMFTVAAHCLASLVTPEEKAEGRVYPKIDRFREVACEIAAAICEHAWDRGYAMAPRVPSNVLLAHIKEHQYVPTYTPYVQDNIKKNTH